MLVVCSVTDCQLSYTAAGDFLACDIAAGVLLDAAIGKRGACSFDGRHASVQAAMPMWVQTLLPVVFTHCGAVEKGLLQQMFVDLPRGVPAAQLSRRLREQAQHRRSVVANLPGRRSRLPQQWHAAGHRAISP